MSQRDDEIVEVMARAMAGTDNENAVSVSRAVAALVLEALRAAGMEVAQGWQTIATAPRNKKEVLVYCDDTKEQFVAFHNSGDVWQFAQGPDGMEIVCRPTHWAPLLPPPATHTDTAPDGEGDT